MNAGPQTGNGSQDHTEGPADSEHALPQEPSRRRWYWWVIGAVGVFSLVIALTTTYPSTSRAFCGSCHTAALAADLHAASIHQDVACLSCHGATHGLLGGFAYVPTLLREAVDQISPLPIARGVLDPINCTTCHEEVSADSALVTNGHPGPETDCSTCHGSVAHPGSDPGVVVAAAPHAADYIFVHGRDAVAAPSSCSDCHAADFCSACHVGATFPHPADWSSIHGEESLTDRGPACASCHAPSFCAGCHGVDIPHPESWLGLHFRAVEAPQASACSTCHASRECSVCHAKHSVHAEQRLYDWDVDE